MASILAFVKKAELGTVFDEHATKAMGEAFDAACKDLHDRGSQASSTGSSPTASSKRPDQVSGIQTS
jgi:hypothetical protein